MNNQNNNHEHGGGGSVGGEHHHGIIGHSRVIVVKATHEYHPVNNDELHIRPGDVITITNPEEGGWWEGTLGSKTGWFPSNYVVPADEPVALGMEKAAGNNRSEEYKTLIVNELIESEAAHVREMEEFYERVLKNISSLVAQSHGDAVVSLLQASYSGLISAHKNHIIGPLQGQVSSPGVAGGSLRVGKILMGAAPDVAAAHTSYCNHHPKFVQFIERNQEKLSGAYGDQSGVLRIITCLSAPFRRIEKYGNILSELERYVEEYHVDRGDLQRGVSYYRNLEKSLTSLRKQKEMELEVLTPGAIKDFEGPDVTLLGDIILMNLLFVGRDKQPRYFVLFSNTILILAYDNVSNTLTYKGRIYVSGVTVSCCDGDDSVSNGFEISGPTLHPILVQCPNGGVRNTWLSNLNELLRATRCYSTGMHTNQHFSAQQFSSSSSPTGGVTSITSSASGGSSSSATTTTGSGGVNSNADNLHHHVLQQHHVIGSLTPPVQAWNITRLRPSAPFNPFLEQYRGGGYLKGGASTPRSSSSSTGFERGGHAGGSFKFKSSSFSGSVIPASGIGGGGGGRASGGIGVSNEEDLCVLGIVDGFCNQNNRSSANPLQTSTRNNLHIINISNPNNQYHSNVANLPLHHPLVVRGSATNNIDNLHFSQQQIPAKSLPQLVCNLRDDVSLLNDRIGQLARQLEDDRSFRGQLIEMIGKLGNSDLRNANL